MSDGMSWQDPAQQLHNRLRDMLGREVVTGVNEWGLPIRTRVPSSLHPEGSWEGCPMCKRQGNGMGDDDYQDPDDQQDPFDPRLLGASLRLDTADVIRLAGDGMSWEDTMKYIDQVLYEGEKEDEDEPDDLPDGFCANCDRELGERGVSMPVHQPSGDMLCQNCADNLRTRRLSLRTVAGTEIDLPADFPHEDWQEHPGDAGALRWQPYVGGDTHAQYRIFSYGGSPFSTIPQRVWAVRHHGVYHSKKDLVGEDGTAWKYPEYSLRKNPDNLGSYPSLEEAQDAAHEHFEQTYKRPQKMDDLGSFNGTQGDDEDYGHIFGMLRLAGLDTADLIRLAGDGMSWEDTMAYIDRVLAEGEKEDPEQQSAEDVLNGLSQWRRVDRHKPISPTH